MPKIIEKLRERLMEEAFEEIKSNGYTAMTIRSVAKAVGVGTGTIYNYFPSKEALVASFMLKEWNERIKRIENKASSTKELNALLSFIYGEIRAFLEKFSVVISDENAEKIFRLSIGKYHKVLRNQLTQIIKSFTNDEFVAAFISEAMITWTVEGADVDKLLAVILHERSN